MSRPHNRILVDSLPLYLEAARVIGSPDRTVRLQPSEMQRFFGVPETTARRTFRTLQWTKLMNYDRAAEKLKAFLGIGVPIPDAQALADLAQKLKTWRATVTRTHTEILKPYYKRERVKREAAKLLPPTPKRSAR